MKYPHVKIVEKTGALCSGTKRWGRCKCQGSVILDGELLCKNHAKDKIWVFAVFYGSLEDAAKKKYDSIV